jgi:hypothetical protein
VPLSPRLLFSAPSHAASLAMIRPLPHLLSAWSSCLLSLQITTAQSMERGEQTFRSFSARYFKAGKELGHTRGGESGDNSFFNNYTFLSREFLYQTEIPVANQHPFQYARHSGEPPTRTLQRERERDKDWLLQPAFAGKSRFFDGRERAWSCRGAAAGTPRVGYPAGRVDTPASPASPLTKRGPGVEVCVCLLSSGALPLLACLPVPLPHSRLSVRSCCSLRLSGGCQSVEVVVELAWLRGGSQPSCSGSRTGAW